MTPTSHNSQLDKLRLAVCLLCRDPKTGKFLAVSRRKNRKMFGLPGGKVDPGETLLEALCREVLEETGYDIKDKVLTCLYYNTAEGEFCTYVYLLSFEDLGAQGTPKDDLEIKWIEQEELMTGVFGAFHRQMFASIGNILDLIVG
jgi:8-oxo-dGTP pyrophosphatase MutT (NUDIX family)